MVPKSRREQTVGFSGEAGCTTLSCPPLMALCCGNPNGLMEVDTGLVFAVGKRLHPHRSVDAWDEAVAWHFFMRVAKRNKPCLYMIKQSLEHVPLQAAVIVINCNVYFLLSSLFPAVIYGTE